MNATESMWLPTTEYTSEAALYEHNQIWWNMDSCTCSVYVTVVVVSNIHQLLRLHTGVMVNIVIPCKRYWVGDNYVTWLLYILKDTCWSWVKHITVLNIGKKRTTLSKTCLSAILFTTNPTWTTLGWKPILHKQKLEIEWQADKTCSDFG